MVQLADVPGLESLYPPWAQQASSSVDLQGWARSEAKRLGVPDDLGVGVLQHEGSFAADKAQSPDFGNGGGLGQFEPETATAYGTTQEALRADPKKAITLTMQKLKDDAGTFGGDYQKAAASYFIGAGNVQKAVAQGGSNWLSAADQIAQQYGQGTVSQYLAAAQGNQTPVASAATTTGRALAVLGGTGGSISADDQPSIADQLAAARARRQQDLAALQGAGDVPVDAGLPPVGTTTPAGQEDVPLGSQGTLRGRLLGVPDAGSQGTVQTTPQGVTESPLTTLNRSVLAPASIIEQNTRLGDIPYADQVQSDVQTVGQDTIGGLASNVTGGVLADAATRLGGENLPVLGDVLRARNQGVHVIGEAGGQVASAVVPTNVRDAALTALPMLGETGDALRGGRAMLGDLATRGLGEETLARAPEAIASPEGRLLARGNPGVAGAADIAPEATGGEAAGLAASEGGAVPPAAPTPPPAAPGAVASGYVAPLRPWTDVADEVTTRSDLPGIRQAQEVLAKVGINPSLANDSDVGQAITTYTRQRIAGEQLADTAVTAALDPHAAPFTGSMAAAAPIDREGMMAVSKLDGTVTKAPWQDVFSRPGDYDLTPKQQAYIADFHKLIDQGSAMLEEAGIKVPKLDAQEGWSYVPRQVEGVRGVEVTRSSNPFVQRLYETAQEGVDNGISYSADPRKTAELYLKAAYREVADEQLSVALEKQSITAKELVPQAVKDRLNAAIDARQAAERSSRLEGAQTQRLYQQMTGTDARTANTELQAARRQQSRIEGELAGRSQIQGRVANRLEAHSEPISRASAQAARGDLADATSTLSRYHEVAQDEIDAAQRELRLAQSAEARLKGRNAGQGISAKGIETNPLGNEHRLRDLQDAASRVDDAKQALADAEKRRERFVNIAEDTQRITSREAFTQARQTAGSLGEQRGVNSMQSLTRTPLSYGERLAAAKARVEAGQAAVADARGTTNMVPRGEAGARRLVTPETLASEQAAKTEYTAAKQAYSKSLEAARSRSVAPASLFDANAQGEISVGQWRNRFYPKGDADALKTALDSFSSEGTNPLTKAVGQAVNLTRFGGTMADFGSAPFIQGLPTLARNPIAWAKATALHYGSLVNPRTYSAYVRNNLEVFQTMAAHGVPIGDTEFFKAAEAGHGIPIGKPLEVLPGGEGLRAAAQGVGQQTVGRSRSAFNSFLGVARAELWKSQAANMEEGQLARWVRNMTGGIDSRALGVGPNQRAIEGTWLAFSPKLMRSTVGLVADAMNPTSQAGRQSLRTLLQLAGGATAMYYAVGKALGKPDDEIQQGLNPLNGKRFLSYHVGGQWVGVGGQIRAITQLVVNAAADPKSLATIGRDNPLINYFQSHAGPGYTQAAQLIDLASGGATHLDPYDKNANVADYAKSFGTALLPFGLQEVIGGHPGVAAATSFGLRSSPETTTDARDALTQKLFVRDPQSGEIRQRQAGEDGLNGVLNYNDLQLQSQKDLINSQGRVTDLQTEKGPSDLKTKTDAIKTEYDQKDADAVSSWKTNHAPKTLPDMWNDISQQRRAAEEEFQRENAGTLTNIPQSRIQSVTQGYYDAAVQDIDPTTGKPTGALDFDATRAKQLAYVAGLSSEVKDGASDRQIMDDWLQRTEGQKSVEHQKYDQYIQAKQAAGYFDIAPDDPKRGQKIAALDAAHPDLDLQGWLWKGGSTKTPPPTLQTPQAVDQALALAPSLANREVKLANMARPINFSPQTIQAWSDTRRFIDALPGYVAQNADATAARMAQNNPAFKTADGTPKTYAQLDTKEQGTVRSDILSRLQKVDPQVDAVLAFWGRNDTLQSTQAEDYLRQMATKYRLDPAKDQFLQKLKVAAGVH